jgi:hypothetical protein
MTSWQRSTKMALSKLLSQFMRYYSAASPDMFFRYTNALSNYLLEKVIEKNKQTK